MQRREFLKGLVSLPLLAAIPVTALFKPQTVQEIIDGWHSEGDIGNLTIWDKSLSAKEITVYLEGKHAHPRQMPAFEHIKHWFRFGADAQSFSVPKGEWVNLVVTTPTETVAGWIRRAA